MSNNILTHLSWIGQQCVIVVFPGHITFINKPQHEISNDVVWVTSKGSDQPAHTRSLVRASASGLNIL